VRQILGHCSLTNSQPTVYQTRLASFKARIDKSTKKASEASEAAVVLKEVVGLPNPIINLFLNYSVADENRRGNILSELDKRVIKVPLTH